MSMDCVDCGATLEVPQNPLKGEIVSCPDCGLDYVVAVDESGMASLQELMIEGEDWGE